MPIIGSRFVMSLEPATSKAMVPTSGQVIVLAGSVSRLPRELQSIGDLNLPGDDFELMVADS